MTTEEIRDQLKSPLKTERRIGWDELRAMGAKAIPILADIAEDVEHSVGVRCRAVSRLDDLGELQWEAETDLELLLADPFPRETAWICTPPVDSVLPRIIRLLNEKIHPRLQRQILKSLHNLYHFTVHSAEAMDAISPLRCSRNKITRELAECAFAAFAQFGRKPGEPILSIESLRSIWKDTADSRDPASVNQN